MHIIIVWAGGSWISNIAHLLRDLGYTNLIAIDAQESQITQALREKKIPVIIGHGKYQPKADDILIYSEATKESTEVQSASQLKREQHFPMKIWNYFEFLGEITKYFRTVGFAGTNGKSSSTSLAIVTGKKMIPELGLGIVGALVPDLNNKSYYLKEDKKSEFRQLFDFIFTGKKLPYELIKKYYFFLEACEYKRHFLNLDLEYLLITNIELDHTDYYRDFSDYQYAFVQMNQKTKNLTFVLDSFEAPEAFSKTKQIPLRHWNLDHIRGGPTDCNASLVAGLFQELNPELSLEQIEKEMKPFKGIWRRMEILTTLPNWEKLFSDYGHIASSIELAYETLRNRFPDHKLLAIFQPHQTHRVLKGRSDFQKALAPFDQRAIFSIYTAREKLSDFAGEPLFQEQHFQSFSEFWAYFAKAMKADYLDTFQEVQELLSSTDKETIVIVFTAWDLDYQLRTWFHIS